MYALITGASSGCGYEYARIMAQKGYKLLIVSNEEAIHDKANLIRKEYGVEVIALVQNLGTQTAAKELYDYCKQANIEVEVLINNAGVYHDRDFLDGLVTKTYEFGNKKVKEHLCGIYEFLETKKLESLQELERKK